MSESIANEITLYAISKGNPNILRFYDNQQEAQKALGLIRDAFKASDADCKYSIFAVTLTMTNPD